MSSRLFTKKKGGLCPKVGPLGEWGEGLFGFYHSIYFIILIVIVSVYFTSCCLNFQLVGFVLAMGRLASS